MSGEPCLGILRKEAGVGSQRIRSSATDIYWDSYLEPESMDAHGLWKGGFATELDDGRGHRVLVDLPEDENGQNSGTSALELSVLSLAGCITTIFAIVAKKRRLPFGSLQVDLRAHRSRGAATITSVDGVLEVSTPAAREEVEVALAVTLRTCPVGVLFEQAHIPVHLEVRLNAPALSGEKAPP